LGDSNVTDEPIRELTVHTDKSVLTKVNPVSNDPASYWEVGSWSPNESTQVTFTGRQRTRQESKYTPKFSGSAKNTNGRRGGDPNYNWIEFL
jgi:hypothetical protein